MKLHANDPIAKDVKIVDIRGVEIPLVHMFDTETKEAELFIKSTSGKVVVVEYESEEETPIQKATALLVKTRLPGCRAINKVTGEEIK